MSWRELIEQVVPPDKREEYRITAMGPPASPSALADVEAALNVALPAELRSLLEEMNGVHDRFFRIILSAEDIQEVNLAFRNDADYPELYMPFDCLLFFAESGTGDMFAYAVLAGMVRMPNIYAWNHEDDSRRWVAPSLDIFIEWWVTGKIRY
jgi:hypothetical protein